MREDENIEGIFFCDKNRIKIGEVKKALFADDTQCDISDLKSIEIWFQHFHTYEWKGLEHICDKIKWTIGKIAALGVNHGIKIEDTIF